MRKCGAAIAGIVLVLVLGGSLAVLGGTVALVETHGNSMSPRITTGDLVIVAEQSRYRVGDVVAYQSRDLQEVVLHRVKAIHGDRYTFRGDHNGFDDPERPVAGQLIGREVIHLPGGGVWLDRLAAPHFLAIIAFALVLGAGDGRRSHKRRKSRRRPMAQQSRPAAYPRQPAGLARTSAAVALFAVAVCLAGIVLSGPAWTTPGTQQRPALPDAGSRLTFSYRAEVPLSPAYDGTTVTSPDPLFRALVDTVRLSYSYTGRPGTIRLDAEISSSSGWHTRVPLRQAVRFDESRVDGHVDLDLDDLDKRAAAAAAVIGMPIDQVTVDVVPTVRSADGGTFAPRLTFALTPTQLRLASERPQLEFRDRAGPTAGAAEADSLEIAGRAVEVSALRLGIGGASAIALGVLVWSTLAGRRRKGNEARLSPGKYRGVLEVDAIVSPPGWPVVDVTDFAALSRLARRYGVLVMHWTRGHVRTFEVHDDGVTYRYRVDVVAPRASSTRPRTRAASQVRRRSPGELGDSIGQV